VTLVSSAPVIKWKFEQAFPFSVSFPNLSYLLIDKINKYTEGKDTMEMVSQQKL